MRTLKMVCDQGSYGPGIDLPCGVLAAWLLACEVGQPLDELVQSGNQLYWKWHESETVKSCTARVKGTALNCSD